MTVMLLIFVLLSLICEPVSLSVRCKPPDKAEPNDRKSDYIENNQTFPDAHEDDSDNKNTIALSSEHNVVGKRTIDVENPKKERRQRTFIRNPNYKRANKIFDKLAENMYITELPSPHPGAQPGSTNGCEVIEDEFNG